MPALGSRLRGSPGRGRPDSPEGWEGERRGRFPREGREEERLKGPC